MKSIGVFCGSSAGKGPVYANTAVKFARILAEKNITLVYGAGNIGLMGVLADTMLSLGGKVIGVIPEFLYNKGLFHHNLTELYVVETMSERKEKIGELSDGFVALPGGFGTLDELAEVLTWYQLEISLKPCAILNVNGFYDPLIGMFDKMLSERFIKTEHRHNIIISDTPDDLIGKMLSFKPAVVEKEWIEELKRNNSY